MRACTSSNSRTFSIAITAWSAKVVDQLDLLVGERPHLLRMPMRRRFRSLSSGTASTVRRREMRAKFAGCVAEANIRDRPGHRDLHDGFFQRGAPPPSHVPAEPVKDELCCALGRMAVRHRTA